MAHLELRQVRKRYTGFEAVKGIDLEIKDREFVVFVGPSGCGKTTLLRMIAGLEEISDGEFLIDGVRTNQVSPDKRGLAMVFQSYALYPHMTVAENIGFSLRMANLPKPEVKAAVEHAAKLLQLEKLLDRRPKMLSGGQRQRVAIGRAIVRNPKGFLFDEPLSNLDASLRVQMRAELVKLNKQLQTTMIYVTHDQTEAMTMADRIAVLNAGELAQFGSPLELYNNPENLFVAGFIGSPKMNFCAGQVVSRTDTGAEVALAQGGTVAVVADELAAEPGMQVTVGMRPEHMALSAEGPLGGQVELVEHLGNETLVHICLTDGQVIIAKTDDLSGIRIGDLAHATARPERAILFGPDGRNLTRRRLRLH
ncbi:MAG: ABC transporter ATP-binding protein [Rhodospirillales bacterium 20-64-7]|nr:MAG: ABC transporter ATP-binding protein [Rhodospirillales bacterium 20-64-7]